MTTLARTSLRLSDLSEPTVRIPLEDVPRTALQALTRPEQFVRAWRDHGTRAYPAGVFPLLLGITIACTAAYGLAMGLPLGWTTALERAFTFPLACGLAWGLALPTLYIVGSIYGLRLDASTTFLVALLTVHYASLAMAASIPVHLFFASALPYPWLTFVVNLLIFTGVGICGADVLVRLVEAVDPPSVNLAKRWLVLLGVLGPEFFSLFGLFRF